MESAANVRVTHLRSVGAAGPSEGEDAALEEGAGRRAGVASDASQSSTVEASLDSGTGWLTIDGFVCTQKVFSMMVDARLIDSHAACWPGRLRLHTD